ncbi:MAG: NAD(P)/FAD-dependent oxidoreductase [Euryarchaeota archaeon]|nr:NAD(P)/FAD-dependent oxidoreductase [Euryarchaeota archaeon]
MDIHDIVILGSGPAGIQAGIHSARRGMGVLVLGKPQNSAIMKGHFENYAFVEGPVDGEALMKAGLAQVRKAGATLLEEDAVSLETAEGGFKVRTESGQEAACRAVVLATGAARKRLGVPGERELEGKGVSYCADCDAGFFKKKRVVVTGDGSAAASGALHLLHFTQDVTLVAGKLAIAPALSEELRASRVRIIEGQKIKSITGDDQVREAVLSDGTSLPADGVFIETGAKGILELGASLGLALNEEGHLAVGRDMATNVPGLFAAGDVTGPPWQMAKAVGEGCVAGLSAAVHVKGGGKG